MVALGRQPCDEGVVVAAPAGPGCRDRDKPWVLAATILGSSLAFIDGTVVNVALPAIQADMAGSVRAVQWIVNAYMLMLGALILVGGSAGDRFGRRAVFILGVGLFTLASVVCGLAPDTVTLTVARAGQGIGGALLIPNSLALISASFPAEERGRAIGTWAGFSALTTAVGPVLGGWLVDALSWRAIFFINVPIAMIVVGIALRRVSESRDERGATAVDWQGALAVTFGLAAITYGLTAASDHGFAEPAVVLPLIAGVLALAAFLWLESRQKAPMLPLALFRSATFSGANTMTLLLYFSLSAALFFLPFNLIQIQGYSATKAGATFLPFTLILGGLSRWSGVIVDRIGPRLPLTAGPLVAAAGIALFAVPGIGDGYWTSFFPAMVVLGLGMAVSVAPLTTTVMAAVEERHSGLASGINNAISRVASMLAIAALGVVAVAVFDAALGDSLSRLEIAPELRSVLSAESSKLAEATVPPQVTGEDRQTLERVLDEAFVASFRAVMLVAASLAVLAGVCAAITLRSVPHSQPPSP